MPENSKEVSKSSDEAQTKKQNISFSEKPRTKPPTPKYGRTPLYIYKFKDQLKTLFSHQYFPDALATTFTLASVSLALPFFPLPMLILLIVLTFIITILQPMFGLMLLLFETLPMFMYQVPLLAWLFTLFMSASFLLGYKHYRSITFIYALIALPFSPFGSLLELPAFIFTILTVGFKRGALAAIIVVLIVCVVSGLTGLPNTGGIVYDSSLAFGKISSSKATQFLNLTKPKPALNLFDLSSGASLAMSSFFSASVTENIYTGLFLVFVPLTTSPITVLVQLLVWVFVVFAISDYAVKSRSKYKGAESSMFSILIPITCIALSYTMHLQINWLVLLSFVIAPVLLLFLEFNDVTVVRALEVMKQDFRGRFGEAFEDLTPGTKETLEDVVDYEETKKELKEAIIAPIERRELAGAYNIKPSKGILLFGPPGTGKTYIMRALANEIRAGFFYVKTSQLLSPYPGASAQTLSRIFTTAKKHAPAILFFDEIDCIASNRDIQESETGRQILSTLLSEMDGFQKIDSVVIVGATNRPQALDPSIMRPGRFDKIIYMPLPDALGRKKIFQYYLKKLPMSSDVDYQKLAELTNRYSGADIQNICEEVAREVAEEASSRNKVLQISNLDLVRVIKATKPSTSLAQIEEYNMFKTDYERRAHQEHIKDETEKTRIEDVVGLEDAKKALYEAVELPILHPELIKKYEIENIRGILLFGPPGTGKTMLMRAVVSELEGVQMITISGAEMSKYGAERAALTIKQSFDRAKENQPSIVFVDEIDAVVPARDTASELGTQLTAEFLQQIDGIKADHSIVVVAASNRPDVLDPALLRPGRLDKIIYVGPPNQEDRAKIFELNLGKVPLGEDVDFNRLSELTPGYTGADIANICRQTKVNALENSLSSSTEAKITMQDLAGIIQKTKPSAPSLVVGRYLMFLSKYGQR